MSKKLILVLDSIRSAHNVGAIFRTADAMGVDEIWLSGYTPAPIDRFGRTQSEIAKTSVGASAMVPWQAYKTIAETVEQITSIQQTENCKVVAVEQTKDAQSLPQYIPNAATIYIMGNEVEGVSSELLAIADTHIEIPMLGQKESLNVSVTTGMVLYHHQAHFLNQ